MIAQEARTIIARSENTIIFIVGYDSQDYAVVNKVFKFKDMII